ncbi:MAG: glycosyltransferase family 39 protein [Candidatus Hydrogenedentes bacterium]|nr:glycosyltransferase family 39 protein [Candidatus Hydrogenedentota bacterium]
MSIDTPEKAPRPGDTPYRLAGWEYVVLAGLVALQCVLGFRQLSLPSLWHDELVHVFVAREIAASGKSLLPSGIFYPSSLFYNYLLGATVKLFGDDATVVRGLTVVTSLGLLVVTHLLLRQLMGRAASLVAVALLVLSPWHLAWTRQSRMYELQALLYMAYLACLWRFWGTQAPRNRLTWGTGAVALYFASVFTSFHSILFLGTAGAFATVMQIVERAPLRSRWTLTLAGCTIAGLLTLGGLWINPNSADQSAVFETGLGGTLPDPQRMDRYLYFRFLLTNHSLGYGLLATAGTALLLWHKKRSGLYLALSFWVPVLVLTLLIGYRRDRFMYFAFPFYIALASYGLVWAGIAVSRLHQSLGRAAIGLLCGMFLIRFAFSQVQLVQDTFHTSRGASITLATRMPEWKLPCAYVKAHEAGHAILTTTCLPVMNYAGRADNWFPNRYHAWEMQESGLVGLDSLEALQSFVKAHPRGFYLSERSRFEMWVNHRDLNPLLGPEYAWIQANMERIDAACSSDVTVYRWGPDTVNTP